MTSALLLLLLAVAGAGAAAAAAADVGVEFDVFPVAAPAAAGQQQQQYWTAGAGRDGEDGAFDYGFWTKVYQSAGAVFAGGTLTSAPASAAARGAAPARELASRAALEALFTAGPDRRARTAVLLGLYDADDAADTADTDAANDGDGGGGGIVKRFNDLLGFGGDGGDGDGDDDGDDYEEHEEQGTGGEGRGARECRAPLDAAWVTWAKRWTGPTLVDVAVARKPALGSAAFLSTLVRGPRAHENALHRNCSAVLHWPRGAPLRGGASLCAADRCSTPHGPS